MLKIKDDVDLKELEKFGAKKEDCSYFIDTPNCIFNYIEIDEYSREIIIVNLDNKKINDTIFDLIQAGLVEKV